MRPPNDVWQGSFGEWQSRFIHHHILSLGHVAWGGYRALGRGLVVCELLEPVPPYIDWRTETVAFEQRFVPQANVAAYLEPLGLQPAVRPALLSAIAAYDPNQAMVVLVQGNGSFDLNLLQNLAISPADCYRQVQQRWAEFQPGGFSPCA